MNVNGITAKKYLEMKLDAGNIAHEIMNNQIWISQTRIKMDNKVIEKALKKQNLIKKLANLYREQIESMSEERQTRISKLCIELDDIDIQTQEELQMASDIDRYEANIHKKVKEYYEITNILNQYKYDVIGGSK